MSSLTPRPDIQSFFDPATGTVSHIVACPRTGQAAIVDPVLDFHGPSASTRTTSAQRLLDWLAARGQSLQWILETHAHADHLSAAHWLRSQAGGRIGIGQHIVKVQATFQKLFHLGGDFPTDGRQFDHLFTDGEAFRIGEVVATAWWVPGHTPADMAYRVEGAVLAGDTLFQPDVGTARADFPGGDARTLYRSVRRLLDLPPDTRVLTGHDYPPGGGRPPAWEATVAQHRAHNVHVHDGVGEDAFVSLRQARDATLEVPHLMLPAIQVNIRAGALPPPEDDGVSYLRLPLNVLGSQGKAFAERIKP